MSAGVTERIARHVRQEFPPPADGRVLAALADWRISYEEEAPGERLVAAALFYAAGDENALDDAFDLAEQDWRDLLVAGELAHDDWQAELDRRLGGA